MMMVMMRELVGLFVVRLFYCSIAAHRLIQGIGPDVSLARGLKDPKSLALPNTKLV